MTQPHVPAGAAATSGPDDADDVLELLEWALDLARAGDTDRLLAALDAGVPVDLTSPRGDSLLVLAAYHDHPGTVRSLLARGADTARINDAGQTALGAAVFRRSEPAVDALLAAGADPHLGARSAVAVAAFFGLEDMTARLLGPDRSGQPSR